MGRPSRSATRSMTSRPSASCAGGTAAPLCTCPFSVAPNGSRLLMVREKDVENQPPDLSPFQIEFRQAPDDRVTLARFDADRMAFQLAEKEVELSVLDVTSGEV